MTMVPILVGLDVGKFVVSVVGRLLVNFVGVEVGTMLRLGDVVGPLLGDVLGFCV